MSLAALDNLARIGQFKPEPRKLPEFERVLEMARTSLADAQCVALSSRGQFASTYSTAHATAVATLRWHDYPRESRRKAFQCLAHTLNWPAPRWQVLGAARQKRNVAEYERFLEVEESDIATLCVLESEPMADSPHLQGSNL